MLKKSGSFMMARGVELWGRGGFMLKESGGFMMVQNKTKLLRFGPGRAHHSGTLLGGWACRASHPWPRSFIV